MEKTLYKYEGLSTRQGFNRSLAHFKSVSFLVDEFEEHQNLADLLNDLINENELEPEQFNSILYALLVDKYGYQYRSYNIEETIKDYSKIHEETIKWKAIDIVLSYYHPELGVLVINPKNKSHWDSIDQLKKDELVTIYVGTFEEKGNPKAEVTAIDKMIALFQGKKPKTPQVLLKGKYTYKKKKQKQEEQPEPKRKRTASKPSSTRRTSIQSDKYAGKKPDEAAPKEAQTPSSAPQGAQPTPHLSQKKRITPTYAVPVTNELFHNGNVEAWKKIIQSYQTKYPRNDVYIFYEGEKINDINTLFKWGKVKHGSSILFAVAGDDIKEIAKLQRYLRQGASPQFEAFLKAPVNQVLNLF